MKAHSARLALGGRAVGGDHVDPLLTSLWNSCAQTRIHQDARARASSALTGCSSWACPTPEATRAVGATKFVPFSAAYTHPWLSWEAWKDQEEGGSSCLARDLRDRVGLTGGWPFPWSSPLDLAGALTVGGGWPAALLQEPLTVCAQLVLTCAGSSPLPPPPWAHPLVHTLPTPKQACPSRGRARRRARGGAPSDSNTSSSRDFPAGRLSLGLPFVSPHLFPHLSPHGHLLPQFTPARQPHSCCPTDRSLCCLSGKGRNNSLSGNYVICHAQVSWLPAFPDRAPSPLVLPF